LRFFFWEANPSRCPQGPLVFSSSRFVLLSFPSFFCGLSAGYCQQIFIRRGFCWARCFRCSFFFPLFQGECFFFLKYLAHFSQSVKTRSRKVSPLFPLFLSARGPGLCGTVGPRINHLAVPFPQHPLDFAPAYLGERGGGVLQFLHSLSPLGTVSTQVVEGGDNWCPHERPSDGRFCWYWQYFFIAVFDFGQLIDTACFCCDPRRVDVAASPDPPQWPPWVST